MTDVKVNPNPDIPFGEIRIIEAKDIEIVERARKDFSHVPELSESIKEHGLDNPVTVAPNPPGSAKPYRLVAGESRYRAMLMIPCLRIPCLVRERTPLQQKAFELAENLNRKDLDWQERIEGERQYDLLKRAEHPEGWTMADTAKDINSSKTTVTRNIALAQKLADRPDLKEAVKNLPQSAAAKRIERIEEAERVSKAGVVVNGIIRRGDSRELLKDVATGSVSLVLTDPPFGLSTLERDRGRTGEMNPGRAQLQETDNMTPEGVAKLLKWFIPEAFRVLREGGHFYCFFCQQHWGLLREAALSAGFEIQEWPIVWYKGRTTAPGTGYTYAPCCEPILFGWKPPRKRMLERNLPALLEVSPIRNTIHPFQKPVDLLTTLIKQSTIEGEIVLDPFCGSASTVVAALRAGRVGLGFDLDPEGTNFKLAEARVAKVLAEIAALKNQDGKGAPQ